MEIVDTLWREESFHRKNSQTQDSARDVGLWNCVWYWDGYSINNNILLENNKNRYEAKKYKKWFVIRLLSVPEKNIYDNILHSLNGNARHAIPWPVMSCLHNLKTEMIIAEKQCARVWNHKFKKWLIFYHVFV